MIAKTLRAIVTEQKLPALGSADDAETISDATQWLVNQGKLKKQPVELDIEGLPYNIEGTVHARDVGDLTFGTKTGGTFIARKDWGNYATADEARNRAHLVFSGGDRVKVGHPLRITGPHGDSEPNKSPGYVLEQQCGIWLQSITVIEAIGQDIDHVWGDFIDIGFDAKDDRRTEKATIIPGRWDRCGRVGFNAGGTASNVEFAGDGTSTSFVKRCPGDIFHCEIQGAGGFRNWNVHDLMVYGHLRAHISGMNECQDIRIHNNVATGHCFTQIVPNPGVRIRGIVAIQDNHWSESGDVCNLFGCELAVVTGNVGPVPKSKPLLRLDGTTAVMRFMNCTTVSVSPNELTRV